MSYCVAHVRVRHANDFISILSKHISYPSVLTHFYLSGGDTVGLLVFPVNDGELVGAIVDIASSISFVKELTPLCKDLSVFYMRKLSFGIQKALMELGLPKPNIIYHDVSGNKHFMVVMPCHTRDALVSNIKKNALLLGEETVSVKLSLKPSILRRHHANSILNKKSAPGSNWEMIHHEGLTTLEHRILWEAYIRGYFEWPKRCSLEDLSRTFNISKAAILEHLRKALKKVVKEYLTVYG
ncbi:MAG: helix-turn-helix domain-containing protein [Desulfurococcaceae archaeon]